MAKPWAESFYKSKAWLTCRRAYIAQRVNLDGGLCEHCSRRLGYIVDHKEELTPSNITDVGVSLSHDNLQYLCQPCHNRKTFGKGNNIGFDENGRPRSL